MKKKSTSKSAFFNLRILIASVLCLFGVLVALLASGVFSNVSAQANATQAQAQGPKAQQPGQMIVIPASHADASRPLREQLLEWPPREKLGEEHQANLNPKIPHKHQDRPDPVVQDSFFQRLVNTPAVPGPILTWDGIPFPGVVCNCAPPDTNGQVGKTQYVQTVNEGIQVWDKITGVSVFGPVAIRSLWGGFGGVCETAGSGHPVVNYDRLADRWVVSQSAIPTGASVPMDECIAVSQTGDGTGAYYRYQFHLTNDYLDYPKIGVWPDGYYMAANIFNTAHTAFLGPQAFVFNRMKMLVGDPSATGQTLGITGGPSETTFCLPIWTAAVRRQSVIRTISWHGPRASLSFIRSGRFMRTSSIRGTRPLHWRPHCRRRPLPCFAQLPAIACPNLAQPPIWTPSPIG